MEISPTTINTIPIFLNSPGIGTRQRTEPNKAAYIQLHQFLRSTPLHARRRKGMLGKKTNTIQAKAIHRKVCLFAIHPPNTKPMAQTGTFEGISWNNNGIEATIIHKYSEFDSLRLVMVFFKLFLISIISIVPFLYGFI